MRLIEQCNCPPIFLGEGLNEFQVHIFWLVFQRRINNASYIISLLFLLLRVSKLGKDEVF